MCLYALRGSPRSVPCFCSGAFAQTAIYITLPEYPASLSGGLDTCRRRNISFLFEHPSISALAAGVCQIHSSAAFRLYIYTQHSMGEHFSSDQQLFASLLCFPYGLTLASGQSHGGQRLPHLTQSTHDPKSPAAQGKPRCEQLHALYRSRPTKSMTPIRLRSQSCVIPSRRKAAGPAPQTHFINTEHAH